MEVVASTEVVVFSFGILVCTDRRELPILTTRKHQNKKKPHRKEQCSMQQGSCGMPGIYCFLS